MTEAAPKKKFPLKKKEPIVTVAASGDEPSKEKKSVRLPFKRHDYDAARAMYVEQSGMDVTLKDVAEALNINYTLLRRKSADEHWTAQRAEFQSKAAISMAKNRVRRLVKDGEAFDDRTLQAARVGQDLIAGRLAQLMQLFQAQQPGYSSAVQRLKAGLPVSKEELYGSFYPKDLTELARSLELFQKAGKLAIGIDITNFDRKELVDQAESAANPDGDVSIVEELRRPDMDRMAALIETMERMGVGLLGTDDMKEAEDDSSDVSAVPGGEPLTQNSVTSDIANATKSTDQPAA